MEDQGGLDGLALRGQVEKDWGVDAYHLADEALVHASDDLDGGALCILCYLFLFAVFAIYGNAR